MNATTVAVDLARASLSSPRPMSAGMWSSARGLARGFCREFGMEVSVGAARGLAQIARLLADEHSAIPSLLRTPMRLALAEIRLMEARIDALERERCLHTIRVRHGEIGPEDGAGHRGRHGVRHRA